MVKDYQRCTRCVMDTTDPEISFNEDGVCSHCIKFDSHIKPIWSTGDIAAEELRKIIEEIKEYGKGKEYDSIIGLSGGVDSSYLAYLAVELGLRPFLVHVDCGWNSEIAVKNIENLARALNLELHTIVIDWQEMKELQLAYLKAGVPNQDVPQDHAIFAALYKYAVKMGIRYVLNGSNYASESILPITWGYNASDSTNLKSICIMNGGPRLIKYPTLSFWERHLIFPIIKRLKIVRLLNLIDYNKQHAMEEMERKIGWRYYGGKHHESRFTKFFQSYYLVKRFGFDKRLAHLSSLILAGQMSRDEALKQLEMPIYPDEQSAEEDKKYICRKLGISLEFFNECIASPKHYAEEYSNELWLYSMGRRVKSFLKKI